MSACKTIAPPDAATRSFHPFATVKSIGETRFRSQAMRDAACLFDVDPAVASWQCMPDLAGIEADFLVEFVDGRRCLVNVDDRPAPSPLAPATQAGFELDMMRQADMVEGHRLRNARDLLRYANYRVSLDDRVNLLRALDEHGSLSIAECLGAFRETRPMPGLASLILHGFIEVNLDEAPIGPETLVRRIRG